MPAAVEPMNPTCQPQNRSLYALPRNRRIAAPARAMVRPETSVSKR